MQMHRFAKYTQGGIIGGVLLSAMMFAWTGQTINAVFGVVGIVLSGLVAKL
jgi:hypothetical protein